MYQDNPLFNILLVISPPLKSSAPPTGSPAVMIPRCCNIRYVSPALSAFKTSNALDVQVLPIRGARVVHIWKLLRRGRYTRQPIVARYEVPIRTSVKFLARILSPIFNSLKNRCVNCSAISVPKDEGIPTTSPR